MNNKNTNSWALGLKPCATCYLEDRRWILEAEDGRINIAETFRFPLNGRWK